MSVVAPLTMGFAWFLTPAPPSHLPLSPYYNGETFCKYINPGFKPKISEHLFWRTVPLAVSDPYSILADNASYILVDV